MENSKIPENYINRIFNQDCLEFMKTLPDKCIDLVLTDPPYGINVGGKPRERERELKSGVQNHSARRVKVGIKGASLPKVIWGLMTLESQVEKCLKK